MKRNLTILFIGILTTSLFSQSVKTKLYEKKIAMYFDCSLNQKIDLEINDTSYYLFCAFQNMEYTYITDIGGIYCGNRDCMEKLLLDLKKIIELQSQNPNIEYEVESGGCILRLKNKNMWIFDNTKYTYLNIKYVKKYYEWLSEVLADNRIQ